MKLAIEVDWNPKRIPPVKFTDKPAQSHKRCQMHDLVSDDGGVYYVLADSSGSARTWGFGDSEIWKFGDLEIGGLGD